MTFMLKLHSSALYAEFFEDTSDSSLEDSDSYILEIAPQACQRISDGDIESEIESLIKGNDRAELALMRIPTIHENDEVMDLQPKPESPQNEDHCRRVSPESSDIHNLQKAYTYAIDAVRIGHTERRRSIGNSAA